MKKKTLIVLGWMVALCAPGSLVWAQDEVDVCEVMRDLRIDGEFSAAEEAARSCLELRPDDEEVKLELARALYAQERVEDAVQWAMRVVEVAPDNEEALVFSARLIGHGGDYEQAIATLSKLPDETRDTAEVKRLHADLVLWSGEYAEAATEYALYLSDQEEDATAWTNLGHAQVQSGEVRSAQDSYQRGCELGDRRGCDALSALQDAERRQRFLRLEPGYSAVIDGANGHYLRVTAGVEAETSLALSYHQITRGFDDGQSLRDHGLNVALGRQLGSGVRVGTGAGIYFDPHFSPLWSGYAEAAWSHDVGLEPGLRLWRMHFRQGGANIINPSLTYYVGPLVANGRYYLSIDDDGGVDHAAMGLLGYYFGDHTSVRAGFGAGTRPDYVDLTALIHSPTLSHYTAVLGGSIAPGERHRFDLTLQYRHEGSLGAVVEPSSSTYRSVDVILGYSIYNW